MSDSCMKMLSDRVVVTTGTQETCWKRGDDELVACHVAGLQEEIELLRQELDAARNRIWYMAQKMEATDTHE